jgi:hypothetical protein
LPQHYTTITQVTIPNRPPTGFSVRIKRYPPSIPGSLAT